MDAELERFAGLAEELNYCLAPMAVVPAGDVPDCVGRPDLGERIEVGASNGIAIATDEVRDGSASYMTWTVVKALDARQGAPAALLNLDGRSYSTLELDEKFALAPLHESEDVLSYAAGDPPS